jgi:hypothetical protein
MTTSPDGAPQFIGMTTTTSSKTNQIAGDIFQNAFHGTTLNRTSRSSTPT